MSQQRPLKSIPGVIFFCLFLGPIGLLYSSVIGSIFLLFLCFVSCHLSGNLAIQAGVLIWLISCIWGVIAANRYNQKLIEKG